MDEWHAGLEIRKEGRGDGGAHSFRWRWEIGGDVKKKRNGEKDQQIVKIWEMEKE